MRTRTVRQTSRRSLERKRKKKPNCHTKQNQGDQDHKSRSKKLLLRRQDRINNRNNTKHMRCIKE